MIVTILRTDRGSFKAVMTILRLLSSSQKEISALKLYYCNHNIIIMQKSLEPFKYQIHKLKVKMKNSRQKQIDHKLILLIKCVYN